MTQLTPVLAPWMRDKDLTQVMQALTGDGGDAR